NTQIKQLKKDYKIVMWSVLTGDFDPKVSREKVLRRSVRYTKKGSIIVFHDNNKFKDKMLYALKGFLQHFSELNYNFNPIIDEDL
ncbi:MAG: polysaccharide deacetylase family protein, partial [Bacteroidales bacterium]|nr:polysaccharide deacetylase family protein [Bacteroidales bacterium]